MHVVWLITQRRLGQRLGASICPQRSTTAGRQADQQRIRRASSQAAHALAVPIAPVIALMVPVALGLSGVPVHEPVHAKNRCILALGPRA